jgi:transposase
MSMSAVHQAYRFALDPTPAQERDLASHCGAARFAYNWALAAVKANLDQRQAERSYDTGQDALTPVLGWGLPALRRATLGPARHGPGETTGSRVEHSRGPPPRYRRAIIASAAATTLSRSSWPRRAETRCSQ